MEIKDIIAVLRREKGLGESQASEQTYKMLAVVKGRHPRVEVTAIVVDGSMTTICLANGTQVKFDPSIPVPIWKYPENRVGRNPKTLETFYMDVLDRLFYLEEVITHCRFSPEEKESAKKELQQILAQRGASSANELRTRILSVREGEFGDSIH